MAAVAVASATRAFSSYQAGRRGGRGFRRRRSNPLQPVPIDRAFGDPELATLRKAVQAGSWSGVELALRPVRARGDFERLSFLMAGVEDVGGPFLLELPDRLPQDPLALTLAGVRHTAWAWEARTGHRASQVSQEQFRRFHDRLKEAEEYLFTAVELDPDSAAPWYSLCIISRGLEHGADVTRRRFEAGIRRSPGHVGLHKQMLQQLCAKWGGSHERMHAFADEALAAAPPGSGLGELVPLAHLEHWLDLDQGPDEVYIRSGSVRQRLRAAADASVFHPAFAPTTSPYPALNTFAMAFWLAGDKEPAARLFERIGGRATRAPWQYRGDPGQVFAVARQDCVKKRKK